VRQITNTLPKQSTLRTKKKNARFQSIQQFLKQKKTKESAEKKNERKRKKKEERRTKKERKKEERNIKNCFHEY
jgi:hypothetical protein